MLSLVGYFQLNNIVENHSDFDPGKILDMLDEKVNDTLIKTGNSDNIKDGMDVAFCAAKDAGGRKVSRSAAKAEPTWRIERLI